MFLPHRPQHQIRGTTDCYRINEDIFNDIIIVGDSENWVFIVKGDLEI